MKTAINDAKSIAASPEKTYGFKVRLLLDPTRGDIIDAFNDISRRSSSRTIC